MLKQEKERLVAELTERLKGADTLIVADYRGLSVTDIDKLRTDLLAHGARFSVVKNTLTRRAAEAAGTTELLALFEGPTAIAFLESEGDPVAVAKALNDAAKGEVLTIKGGRLQGTTMTADSVKDLASLPPVDTLRAQLAGAILSPLTTVVMLLAAPLHDLVGLIDARIRQLEEEGAAEPPVRDSGPGEGVSGEPGGSLGADQEPEAAGIAEEPAEEPAAEEPAGEEEPTAEAAAEQPAAEAAEDTTEESTETTEDQEEN
jgi:large subunit ribosomal protein L10